jgi:hypothetical protein
VGDAVVAGFNGDLRSQCRGGGVKVEPSRRGIATAQSPPGSRHQCLQVVRFEIERLVEIRQRTSLS